MTDWTNTHPTTNEQLFRMELFNSLSTATAYTARRRNAGTLQAVATVTEVSKNPKRKKVRRYPNWLFCGWWVKPQQGWHEAKGTDFALLYWPYCECWRGPNVDKAIRPDIEFSLPDANDFFAYVEIDCGTEGKEVFQARCEHYLKVEDPVLFVVACNEKARKGDNKRLEEIERWGAMLSGKAHFATLKDVQAAPYGKVWDHLELVNGAWEWVKTAIPRPPEASELTQVSGDVNDSPSGDLGRAEMRSYPS